MLSVPPQPGQQAACLGAPVVNCDPSDAHTLVERPAVFVQIARHERHPVVCGRESVGDIDG